MVSKIYSTLPRLLASFLLKSATFHPSANPWRLPWNPTRRYWSKLFQFSLEYRFNSHFIYVVNSSSLGYAFHIASILPKEDVTTYFDRISGVISQVDEIDSKYYQFEGGLTLTGECCILRFTYLIRMIVWIHFSALIVEGIYKLSEAAKKQPPLNNNQLGKFLNYFLSRLTVSRPRGVFGLLQVLSKLSENDVRFSHFFILFPIILLNVSFHLLSIIRMGYSKTEMPSYWIHFMILEDISYISFYLMSFFSS